MFGELPKLFDRNFAMAFFLPVVLFIGLIAEIASRFDKGDSLITTLQADLIVGATLLGAFSWLGGIFLLVTNRGFYRFLEGYGKWNPLKVFGRFEKRYYSRLVEELSELDEQYRACIEADEIFPAESHARRSKLMEELAERFPDKESLLLPTPFGNTLRSFEIYPRVMYGIESIYGWTRLLAIIPKEYRELMDNAKTQVDFWMNVGFLSILLLLEYAGLAIYTKSLEAWWIPILILVVAVFSPGFARNSAVEWGDYVKSAFDVFAPKLRETLGMPQPADREHEKEQWTHFSQAINYRLPWRMPEFKKEDHDEEGSRSFLSWLFRK
jgi:hypothetical protein